MVNGGSCSLSCSGWFSLARHEGVDDEKTALSRVFAKEVVRTELIRVSERDAEEASTTKRRRQRRQAIDDIENGHLELVC